MTEPLAAQDKPTWIDPDINALFRQLEDVSAAFNINLNVLSDTLFIKTDDWSFLIKASALLETAVTHLVETTTSDKKLKPLFDVLAKRGMSDKLKYVTVMKVLEPPMVQFIKAVGDMRNHAVHDIRNLGFTFRDFLTESRDIRGQLVGALVALGTEKDTTGEVEGLIDLNPRALVMLGTARVLVAAYVAHRMTQFDHEQAWLDTEFLRAVRTDAGI